MRSLCTGYGGLDLAVMAVLGGQLAWCADNDRHVCAILAARVAVPNRADIADTETSETVVTTPTTAGAASAGLTARAETGMDGCRWFRVAGQLGLGAACPDAKARRIRAAGHRPEPAVVHGVPG